MPLAELVPGYVRSGKVRGVRFSTLARLCAALQCQPGEILSYEHDPEDLNLPGDDGED